MKPTRIMTALVCLICLGITCLTSPANAEFYQYTDDSGVHHFTENYWDVPEQYRSQIDIYTTYENEDSGEVQKTEQQETPKEEAPQGEITHESLTAKKAELDKVLAGLTKRRDDLLLKPPEMDDNAYIQAVDQLNKDILAFQEQQKAFDQMVETYNEQITPPKDKTAEEEKPE